MDMKRGETVRFVVGNKGTTMHLLSVLPFTRLLSQPKMEDAHMDHARSTQRIKNSMNKISENLKKQIKQNEKRKIMEVDEIWQRKVEAAE